MVSEDIWIPTPEELAALAEPAAPDRGTVGRVRRAGVRTMRIGGTGPSGSERESEGDR